MSFGRLGAVERGFLRLVGSKPDDEQDWKGYGITALIFTGVFVVFLYLMLRIQGGLPLNPDDLPGVSAPIALNTAASFVTNTNWQYYGGEYTMSYLTQMAGLAVQNFVSAAAGMAVLAAVVRGFARRSTREIGLFWRDLYRSLVYILLPLAVVLAIVLISQGVPQTFDGHATAHTVEGATQTIARGPVASQIAIKQLGTNGGGFYNSNSAVPFENPNGLTNFLEMLAILLIPAAQVFMFGRMVGSMRQASAILAAMVVLMLVGVAIAYPAEQHGSQVLRDSGVNLTASADQSGGNMSDKEVRFGIANTALWATVTTDASNGSVNGGHDAFTPIGGSVPLVNMFFGEVDLRRRRLGAVRHVLLRADRRVRRRPDGRAHAGVPGQEDRGARDQVRGARGAVRPLDGAGADGDRGRHARRPGVHLQPRRPRLHARRCTPTRRSRTTTAARSPGTARSRSRPTWAASRSTSDGSSRCSRRSRSAARWLRRRRYRRPRARSAPTARRSPSCWWRSSSSPPA